MQWQQFCSLQNAYQHHKLFCSGCGMKWSLYNTVKSVRETSGHLVDEAFTGQQLTAFPSKIQVVEKNFWELPFTGSSKQNKTKQSHNKQTQKISKQNTNPTPKLYWRTERQMCFFCCCNLSLVIVCSHPTYYFCLPFSWQNQKITRYFPSVSSPCNDLYFQKSFIWTSQHAETVQWV